MKTLYFVRHAKSDWSFPGLSDHDRPLNERGRRDAPKMASKLSALLPQPKLLVSSTALRAYTTATYFANAMNIKLDAIIKKKELYEASEKQIFRVIQQLPEDIDVVMLFGHNPTLTDLANIFASDYIPNIPTCGVFWVQSETKYWSLLDESNSKLCGYLFPKMYSNG